MFGIRHGFRLRESPSTASSRQLVHCCSSDTKNHEAFMFIAQSTPQLVSLSEILSVILSFVALVVTIVGFFASLKFYRDGVTLQRSANDAQTKLEEKTQF